MKISLDRFEHQVDETILKRGFNYFRNGHVTDVDESDEGIYEVTVEGSETYTVTLNVQGNAVTDYECDCPYDMGPICKHIVAALYYLQNNISDPMKLSAKTMQNKQKEKPVARQAEELLDILSHDDLKAFIHTTCANDSKFRQMFVAKHIHLLYPESKELYCKQLQALIKTYSDKYGFVGYREGMHLASAVHDMSGQAMNCLNEGQIQKSMFIALAIIENMAELLNYNADDSHGEIGGCIEEAFDVLEALTELNLNEMQHNELFESLLTLFENNSLEGWDWYFSPVALCIKLAKTHQETGKIKSALDKIKPNGQSWDWNYRRAQNFMLELIKKTEAPEAATRFMENNLSNPGFRIQLIEKALSAKDYPKVKKLANEGIVKDEKEAPGQVGIWRNYLLTVYQQTGDVENTIQLTRHLFIHSNGHQHPLSYYYELLKSSVPKTQWHNYLNSLIDDIKKESRWIDYGRISQIYIWEASWDKLLELLRQNVSFERIAAAEPYLADSYSDELAILYRELILHYVKHNMGRQHYQTACQYIQRIIKLGARSIATDLVGDLKALYPARRALLEELDKV